MSLTNSDTAPKFLAGGGEMGELTRQKDWSQTPVGHPETWPQSLRTTLSILLNSKFPMFLFWGPELICFYNDAYRPSLGNNGKHPAILGARGEDCWQEIWDSIKPLIDQVLSGGEASWSEDQLLPIYRNGTMEDAYWTFSHSPVNDESGAPAGVFVTCIETTDKVSLRRNLEESNRRFINNILQAPVAMCVLDGETHIVQIANEPMLMIWGKTAEQVLGKPIFEGLPEAKGQGLEALLYSVYHTGEKFTANERLIHLPRNGTIETTFINFVYDALRDANGTISGIVAIATEVTAQVLARQKVEASEKQFRQLADHLPGLVWTTNEHGVQTFASKRWKEFTGIDPQDTDSFAKIVHPDDLDKVMQRWSESLSTGKSYKLDIRIKSITGDYHWFYGHGEAIKNAQGVIEQWIGAFTDLNEQKKAEAEQTIAFRKREESERRFRNIADSAPVLIWMSGTDTLCNFFNTAWLNFTGRSMEQEMGNGWAEGVHPEDFQRCLHIYLDAFEDREAFYMQYRLKRHDGEYRWISDKGVPRFTSDGVFEGYIGACMDIHEQIIYQRKLKQDEERLNIVVEASELGIWELDLKTQDINYSDRYLEILGYPDPVKLTHAQIVTHLHPDDVAIREAAFKRAYATGVLTYESRIIWNDGSIHWIEGKGKVFYDAENLPALLIGTVRDITEEKDYQLRLEEREQKFRLLADSMPQFVWTGDAQGNPNYFNQAVYNYSGLTPEQIEANGWLQIVHPDDHSENVDLWLRSVATGEDFLFDHRFRRHDGVYRWQLSRAIPQKGEDGVIKMWVGTSTDIEAQKTFTQDLEKQVQERTVLLQESNEKLEDSIRELQKSNAELQSFAYVSSHDLQEPLRKIQTFASRIIDKEDQNLSETGKDYFQRMQNAAKRMQTLIEDLLAYSRTNTTERAFEKINLGEIVAEVKHELKETLVENQGTIDVGTMSEAYIIPFQFRQLLHNLIGNALKFTKPGVPPNVRIESETITVDQADIAGLSPQKTYCHLSVVDNGIGFDDQYKERIFEVFQRLHSKESYKGTGIGLAIVKKIVENHNGVIIASGKVDQGARFDIYVPLS